MHKSNRKFLVLMLAIFFLVTSCNFEKNGKNTLAHYCPGLKINITGMTYSWKNGTKTYTIGYDRPSEKAAEAYFEDKANGFSSSDDKSFDSQDFILVKTFREQKETTEVAYSKLMQQITIVQNGN